MSAGDTSSGKLLVVFGFGPGLGESIARRFSDAGYRMAAVSRDANRVAGICDALNAKHFACDVTDSQQVIACIRRIESALGTPEVVIYNPMQLLIRPFLELTPEDFESVWRVTCFGGMQVAHAALPAMLRAGKGTIIFTGATASTRGSAKFSSLAAAKFGLRGLAQSLAREFGPQGIHVAHAVIDGLIWSPQTTERFQPEQSTCIAPDAIADAYLQLAQQSPSCWTHELDLRPSSGNF